ncbi:uncharacterized protein [Chelonus insularis]|uniref:uncharacterized protein n=1 Tax=Chelonus insularis TaxID=460826 RepID=UPI00158D4D0D|nr:uncharacterized protein LOC118069494 [Chelonus insularis]
MAPKATGKPKKFEKLVVGAMKRLQDLQGSSAKEISDFLSHEYDVPVGEIKKQVRLALKRGVSYGILERKNGGMYICNRELLKRNGQLVKKSELVEPCPWMKVRERRKSQRKKSSRRGKSSKRQGRRGGRRKRGRKKLKKRGKAQKRPKISMGGSEKDNYTKKQR